MTVITERRHSGGYLVSEEGPGQRSRDQVTLKQQSPDGAITEAGTVLGKYGPSTGNPVWTANPGNTGNGAMGTITESAGAIVGDYKLEITAAAANAGTFDLYDPNGDHVGQGKVGVAFAGGGLGFTLADGGTDFVVGDGGKITVAANADAGKYDALDVTAADGTQNAAAILYNTGDYSAADTKVTVHSRACEVNGSELIYPSGATANQIAAIDAQLAALGIIVR